MTWKYIQPTKIVFGSGALEKLQEITEQTGGRRGILVTSPSQIRNGAAELIKQKTEGTIIRVFSGVRPNPDILECRKVSELIREVHADFIIALGGGSALDTAKAAAVFSQGDKTAGEYYHHPSELPQSGIPLIAIPTTAGTGSEVTGVAVISNRKERTKKSIGSKQFFPDYALVDPQLTWSVPPAVTASTGMDVLCHALEGYWSVNHQPVSDALAVQALKTVFQYLPQLHEDPQNHFAREKMSEASLLAGLAFALPKTSAPHACSFPLTTHLGIPHGEACAMTVSQFLLFNAVGEKDGRIAALAGELGMTSPEQLAVRIEELKILLGLRRDLSSFNLSDDDIQLLAEESRLPNLKNNPVPVRHSDIVSILHRLNRKMAG